MSHRSQAILNQLVFSGGDHGIHCWWDLIRSKQLSSGSVCRAQVFAGVYGIEIRFTTLQYYQIAIWIENVRIICIERGRERGRDRFASPNEYQESGHEIKKTLLQRVGHLVLETRISSSYKRRWSFWPPLRVLSPKERRWATPCYVAAFKYRDIPCQEE